MKKPLLLIVALFLTYSAAFAQKAGWPEGKTFHHFMSTTFHPAEEGNFKPLREKADSLVWAAEAWKKSPIPADYKEKETKAALKTLVDQTKELKAMVKKNFSDADLLKMITAAHDTFHKVVGECRKDDKH